MSKKTIQDNITTEKYLSLSKEDRLLLQGIFSELSPENLTCDGELSRTKVIQKLRKLHRELAQIEKRIGYCVSEEIVYDNIVVR